MIIIQHAQIIKKGIPRELLNLKDLQVADIDKFKKSYYPLLEKIHGKRVKEIVNKEEVTNWDLILTYQEK